MKNCNSVGINRSDRVEDAAVAALLEFAREHLPADEGAAGIVGEHGVEFVGRDVEQRFGGRRGRIGISNARAVQGKRVLLIDH